MTTETVTPDAGTTNSSADTSTSTQAPAGTSLLDGQTQGTSADQSTEPKPGEGADQQKADDAGKTGDQPAVPEKYDFKMPEGVELDGNAAEEFSTLAKELKLSQADAQRVADIAAKMQQRQAENFATTVKGWADQCKTDKEFGGDNLQQNLGVARKAIDTFGSPELKSLLNSSGLGNHPEFVRFAFKAGKAISEDKFVSSGSRAPTPETSLEKRLYPNMN